MNAFDAAKSIELRSLQVLLPFIEENSGGRFVVTDKGPLAKAFQEQCGDVLFNSASGRLYGVELKAEQKHTGNLFLETWSNRNLDDVAKHGERGSNPGWMVKVRADLLFYHFLDVDALYILPLFRLKQWAFGTATEPAHIYDYPERPQGRYSQLNDTHGRLVPLTVLKAAGLVKVFHPQQVELWPESAA